MTSPTILSLHVRRTRGRLLVRWRAVNGATRYDIVLTQDGGGQRLLHSRRPSVPISGADPASGGTVSVRATAYQRSGALRSTRYRATRKLRTPHIDPLHTPVRVEFA
jgi:hypothetical protein